MGQASRPLYHPLLPLATHIQSLHAPIIAQADIEKWRAKHPNRFAPAMRRKDPSANGRLSAVPLIHTSWPRTTGSSLADLHAPSNSKAMVRNIRMCGVRVWLVTTRPLCGTVESACVWYMLALCGGSMAI